MVLHFKPLRSSFVLALAVSSTRSACQSVRDGACEERKHRPNLPQAREDALFSIHFFANPG